MINNKIVTITSSVLKFVKEGTVHADQRDEQVIAIDHYKKEREAKKAHHQKDKIRMHDLSVRQARLRPIKTGMTQREEVEMEEAKNSSTSARPKLYSDTIKKASQDAAKREPGSTPAWLRQAIKGKKTNEEVELDETKSEDAHFAKQTKKMQDAINLHLRKGKSYTDAVKAAKVHVKEEQELDEGRGRPPKEGSKAWHAAQAKAQSGESSDQEADKNIVNQMRKKPVGDHHSLTFNNGEKKQVHVQHVNKALSMLANTHKPADREKLQNSLAHSHDRFMSTVKSGKPVEDAPRPKVTLAKSAAKPMKEDVKTTSIDVGTIVPRKFRDKFGVLRLANVTKGRKASNADIIKDEVEFDTVELENSLNSLYENLSEENKEIFKQMITDVDGFNELLNFAKEQGL